MSIAKIQLGHVFNKLAQRKLVAAGDLHKYNQKRIEKHINHNEGTGHVNEYRLMQQFEKKEVLPYILAVEYEINDGININHSGDLFCFDGKSELTIVELKCIAYHKNKETLRNKVKDQASKLYARLNSWLTHITNINPSFDDFKYYNLKAACYTDEQNEIIYFK